ncbi:hypothetical protein D3248_01615 [Leucobacter zeae]|nr:hypothetical protein [Leucobacter zeae]
MALGIVATVVGLVGIGVTVNEMLIGNQALDALLSIILLFLMQLLVGYFAWLAGREMVDSHE